MSMTRKTRVLIGLAAAALVAALLFFFMISDGTRRQPDVPKAMGDGQADMGVRIKGPAQLTVILEQPGPNSEYKLGEPMHIKGRVEVPDDQFIFEKEVYFPKSDVYSQSPSDICIRTDPASGF